MAIFNFQKPDKVIMIDSTDFEGKFEFRPLEPGYGLTVVMHLEEFCFQH
jgi:DNA-directed RNA polymerase subunit alpha